MGIGHFIWYPANVDPGFVESFPALITHMQAQGVALPSWLDQLKPFASPWQSREEFIQTQNDIRANQLRDFLESTKAQQTAFMLSRMQKSLINVVTASDVAIRKAMQSHIARLCESPAGIYALIDYVNFKGEGISSGETYNGQGWGLRQVLIDMAGNGELSADDSVKAFTQAADRVLTRRAANAKNTIEKDKWLPGWRARLKTYTLFQWPES